MNEKKYFWFKMEDDFFQKKEIKKLRTIAGGDTFVVIYLKIILLSLKTGGKLYFEGIDDDFASEIALEIDEEKNNVMVTLEFLLRHSVVLFENENEYRINLSNLIGSESSTAIRVRKHREKSKTLQCNEKLLQCNEKLLQCNKSVTPLKQNVNGEIEIEIEIEKEIEKKRKNFSPPSREEIISFMNENQCHIDVDVFLDYYNSNGWKVGKNKMSDWRATVRNWYRRDKGAGKKSAKPDIKDSLREFEEMGRELGYD